ncbi:MAG: molybdenum cofactor guanylyltransferase [Solirubrobacterales bacterium]
MTGAVLAGGASRRFGSPKTLAGGSDPLLHRPLATLRAAFGTAAVVCKPDTPLPDLPDDVPVWHDRWPQRHPLAGVLTALHHAGGRVAVLACDMPLVSADLLRRIAGAGTGTVVAAGPEGAEPLCGVYAPGDAEALREALLAAEPLRRAIERIGAVTVAAGGEELANINRPEQLR